MQTRTRVSKLEQLFGGKNVLLVYVRPGEKGRDALKRTAKELDVGVKELSASCVESMNGLTRLTDEELNDRIKHGIKERLPDKCIECGEWECHAA